MCSLNQIADHKFRILVEFDVICVSFRYNKFENRSLSFEAILANPIDAAAAVAVAAVPTITIYDLDLPHVTGLSSFWSHR